MAPAERFGAYRIERMLGRGGMAEAFAAVRSLGEGVTQRVCIKRLLPGSDADPELMRALLAEARIGAALRHANIVSLLDHGEVEGSPYLALELVEGVDLRRLLRELARTGETMPWPTVSELAFALGHALDFAHAASPDGSLLGVLHRDVSPSNVLLGVHGEIKLADFGIARFTAETHATRTGLLKGKVPYMAPEYVAGGSFDARCDLFALGVTLHECLVGERPFDGRNDAETLERILAGKRIPLARRSVDAPDALVQGVDALLAHDPRDRPATARAFVASLESVAPPVSARRSLALAVRRLVDGVAREASVAEAEVEPTWLFTLDGAEPPPVDPQPRPAPPDATTRTRSL